eukprot:TRINITY_DN5399_c0_g1_i4.p1 TRINITY_DN5399_c0_g1~~TRINITY_DN5399_c0_g1_i4.p1  ORF type:complete len:1125 (+),score=246.07 TRINITY_DN5399_c0_g1_i4:102-3377(+)
MLRSKGSLAKRRHFRKFVDFVYSSRDYFSAVRLILPSLDRERGSYGLKESVLSTCLIDALGISRDSPDALRLLNWRKGGATTGANAGNFPLVASEVLQRRQGTASGGLTIKELNESLDQLASNDNRGEKTNILSALIKKTNALEMKWIIMIILKDLKLGISEKSIFHEFHPDAEDLFNVTCDLKLVCERLKDRTQRHKRQDIEVGKAVRPQLAQRVSDAATAWKKLHGKQVVVECKFDGDRIQIHKNGAGIHFFSRNFIDHPEYGHSMSSIILQNILVDRCILDGEMLVWDASTNHFAEFGSNQEIAKAAKEGLEGHRQLCYVAFDILYVGDTSVIHQSLRERHDLLRKVVKPMKGRLEILVPNGGLNAHCSSGEPCWSLVANNVEDIERFFKETIENRDEGIVLKDLGSKWEPSDRSGKWLKLKPDYIHASSDLDVLIIGGYYGSGRWGGEVAQFLVALAEGTATNAYPKRFISFCRVGTGLSDDELEAVLTKLRPYFRKNEYPKKAPSFYEVTNNSKERPDVWIESPEKSVILSITSDIRTIKSAVFAAPYSLRFPRIDRVRYDKPWHECLDMQSFVDLVHSSNGNAQRGMDHGGPQEHKSKRLKTLKKGEQKTVSVVPAHLIQTDVSGIKESTYIFTNVMFYFVNVPPFHSIDSFHKMVAENGGTFSMNLNDSVTHCIAAERKGIKYQAAMLHGDIIHYSWVLDCCSQKRLLPLQPKYFLFLADSSKNRLQDEVDAFSDYYYWDLDVGDIKQLFNNMDRPEDPKIVYYYKKKYCPMKKWSLFQDCCIYLHHSTNTTFPAAQRRLRNKMLHVVGHQWLEDSLEKGCWLQEDSYRLKPEGLFEQSRDDLDVQVPVVNVENKIFSSSPNRDEKSKRGRPAEEKVIRGKPTRVSVKSGRTGFQPAPRTRAKMGNRRAMIEDHEAENSASSGDDCKKMQVDLGKGSVDNSQIAVEKESFQEKEDGRGLNALQRAKATLQQDTQVDNKGKGSDNVWDIERNDTREGTREVEMARRSDGMPRFEEKEDTNRKLEVMTDPVQAMLLEMIPTLGLKKAESESTVLENEKPQPNLEANPVKKKKVSYKDVAGDLLKDW